MTNRRTWSCRSVRETAVARAEITTIATATAHVYARLTPLPRESPNTPRTRPPAIVPAKLNPTRTPPAVSLRLNSLRMPGKTVGSRARSMEVMSMAPVVITSIHHESGCPLGIYLLRGAASGLTFPAMLLLSQRPRDHHGAPAGAPPKPVLPSTRALYPGPTTRGNHAGGVAEGAKSRSASIPPPHAWTRESCILGRILVGGKGL
jgi:hypothetical protein